MDGECVTLFTAIGRGEGSPIATWSHTAPCPDTQASAAALLVDHHGPGPVRLPGAAAVAFMGKVSRLWIVADATALACTESLGRLATHLPALRRVDLVSRNGAFPPAAAADLLAFMRTAQGALPPNVRLTVGPVNTEGSGAAVDVDEDMPDFLRIGMRALALGRAIGRCRAASEAMMATPYTDPVAPAVKRRREGL